MMCGFEENWSAQLGMLLRSLRNDLGWTQTHLAQKLDVSQDTVSLWETGKSLPDIASLRTLAILFDVSTDFLFGLSDI